MEGTDPTPKINEEYRGGAVARPVEVKAPLVGPIFSILVIEQGF